MIIDLDIETLGLSLDYNNELFTVTGDLSSIKFGSSFSVSDGIATTVSFFSAAYFRNYATGRAKRALVEKFNRFIMNSPMFLFDVLKSRKNRNWKLFDAQDEIGKLYCRSSEICLFLGKTKVNVSYHITTNGNYKIIKNK